MKNYYKNNSYGRYTYNEPRTKKVKHVKLFTSQYANALENEINEFADNNPEFKVLGIKIQPCDRYGLLAVVTYLEDAKDQEADYEDDLDATELDVDEEDE